MPSPRRSVFALVAVALVLLSAWAWWPGSTSDAGSTPPRAVGVVADATRGGAAPATVVGGDSADASPAAEPEEVERREAKTRARHLLGRVVTQAGAPLRGALVRCHRRDDERPGETRTDAEGRFRVRPPAGRRSIRIEVLARGHLRRLLPAPEPDDADLDIGDVIVRRGAVVGGRVVDAAGAPVVGAAVRRLPPGASMRYLGASGLGRVASRLAVGTSAAMTGDDGRFELPHTGAGRFALAVHHPDHPPAAQNDLEVGVGATRDDIVVILPRGTTLRGHVVGLPAARGAVSLLAIELGRAMHTTPNLAELQSQAASSDPVDAMSMMPGVNRVEVAADGGFELRGLPGRVNLMLWAVERDPTLLRSARCSNEERVEIEGGGVHVVDLQYDPGVGVRGRLVDDETGEPIEHARVRPALVGTGLSRLFGGQQLVQPRWRDHADGRFGLAGLRPRPGQTLSIDVRARGYATFRREGVAIPSRGVLQLGELRLVRRR